MAQTISFEELAVGTGDAASLQTALNKLAASLSAVGSAGTGAQAVLQELQGSLRTTAAAAGKTVRSLAKFDEINRLTAPKTTGATSKTAATGGNKSSSGSKAAAKKQEVSVWQQALEALRSAWASFWDYLQTYYAPAIAAWTAAWKQIKTAALSVWEPMRTAALLLWQTALRPLGEYLAAVFLPGVVNSFSQAFAPLLGGVISTAVTSLGGVFVWLCGVVGELVNNVLLPALDLLLTIWQDMMAGISAAWAEYGQPILDGIALALQSVCELLSSLWATVVQPILLQLIELAGRLWAEHLKPLWDNLMLALGAFVNLLLTVWNNALMPLLNWIISTLGPAFVRVFGVIAQTVTAALGAVADCVNRALTVLRELAEYVSLVLQGQWSDAWQSMGSTVSEVWQQIIGTVRSAADAVVRVLQSMFSTVASIIGSIGSAFSGVLNLLTGGLGITSPTYPGKRVYFQVPALASGAVIPPNREFLALLGDQTGGTNIEAPLDTIRQAFAETLAAMGGGDGQPINIYIGEELLDSVVAGSQRRRLLRSGGR